MDQKTKVRCSVGQDCVCDAEQCTYITRFLPFVYIVLEGLTLYTMTAK